MQSPEDRIFLELLISRLERISVDSYWAHRASGVRGALIRILEGPDKGFIFPANEINKITDLGFYILEQASLMMDHPYTGTHGKKTGSI